MIARGNLAGLGRAEIVEPAGDPVGAQLDLRVALEHEVDVDQVIPCPARSRS